MHKNDPSSNSSQEKPANRQGAKEDYQAQSLDKRIELAGERTSWAYERTLLAGERTFSAWVRTGLGSVAAGIGVLRLLEAAEEPWMSRAIGGIFVVVGGLIYIVALWRYYQRYHEMKQRGMKLTPIWLLTLLVLSLIISAALASFLLLNYGNQRPSHGKSNATEIPSEIMYIYLNRPQKKFMASPDRVKNFMFFHANTCNFRPAFLFVKRKNPIYDQKIRLFPLSQNNEEYLCG